MTQSALLRSFPIMSVLGLALLLPGCGLDGNDSAHEVPSAPRRVGELQGSGDRSPFVGQRLRIQGVVTGNFVGGLGGFFMQDAVGEDDGDPATSDGVFVQWSRGAEPKVRRGDRVRVNAVVSEEGPDGASMTTLVDAEVSVLGRAAVAAVSLAEAPTSVADYERFEGMWLRVEGPLTVSGNGSLLRFGELVANFGERLRQPTDVYPPGFDARALEADQLRRTLVLDDGRSSEYPERIGYLAEPLSAEAPLRAGSRIAAAEGLLEQRFGRWTLQVRRDLVIASQAPRPQPPELAPGLRVLSFNLENFFNGNGRGGGFPTPRGAVSREDFERQRAKLVSVITATAPDIVALMEVENDGYGKRSALAQLVESLNQAREEAGEPADYRFIETAEAPGGDQIRVALIYRQTRVNPVGEAAVASGEAFTWGSRPPLLQTFAPASGGAPFSVVVNHWKSKGGCENAQGGDREQGDGQGCWNAARVAAARDLLTWLEQRGGAEDGGRRLLMGDFNAYRQEDPVRLLREAGYRDVLELAGRSGHYSYNYRGLAGSLDHGLASPALAAEVRDAAVWGINADEAEAFKYASFGRNPDWYTAAPWASSDHDPLLLVLRAPEATPDPAR
jgi:predicted extracellular nuclease